MTPAIAASQTAVTALTATPATTGGWIAFSSNSRVLAVASPVDADAIAALWGAIGAADALQRILDLLTSNGLSATPPFALLDFTASLRVIVRGGVTVAVTHGGGVESLAGTGVSTWIERSIDGASAVQLTVVDAVAADVAALPLVSGAAWIASLAIADLANAETPASPANAVAPAPAAAPAAQPAPHPASAPVPSTGQNAPDAAPTGASAAIEAVEPVEIDIEATVTEAPVAEPASAVDNLETSPEGYDYLFGDTMYRSVADAAVRDDETDADAATDSPTEGAINAESEPAGADAEPASGDHDGHTVLTSDIAKLRGRRKPKAATDAPPVAPIAPMVSLVLADGTREPLTQPILVGRSPSVSQVSGGKMPKLITVGGVDQDISRSHVRFALEGGTVVVTDLHSRNGTTIAMPGKDPQKLRAGEPTSVIVGTVVDLGGGVTFTVDEA